jgi:Tol biopolymer transport system component
LFYVAGAADRGAGSGSGLVFDVATGAATSKTWELGYNPLLHWGAAGLRLAAVGPDGRYKVLNLDTGEVARLPAAASPEPMTDVWSADGRHIAYWTTACLEGCGVFACCAGKTQHELLVADVSTGQVRRVAATGDLTIPNGLAWIYGGISFSPDGARIAYAIDGRIHICDIR